MIYDTSNIYIQTINDLHQYVSDEDIFYHYIGDFEDSSWLVSPFRPSEKHPSFKISYYENKWVWIDFGRDPRPSDAVKLIMDLYNIPFVEALNKIYTDIYTNNDHKPLLKKVIKTETSSFCKIRKISTDSEINYWKQALITEKDLEYWNVYSGVIRNNGILWHESKENDPLFIYMWDKLQPIYKGYRPNAPTNKAKFYSKNITGHIQGYNYLPPNGDILIVTKSYKDVIVWSKLGYTAIAPHAETLFLSPFDVYDLQQRFKKIYVNYDNDETGINKCIKFTEEYNLNYFNLPSSTGCKDPFELVIKKGYNELEYLFKEKLKRDEKINKSI